MRVSGCVTEPAVARGNRSAQFFFCNGRYIRSQLLQAAVEQAYRGTLLTGRFPACVVYIDLAPAAVDVNVHPAKTEVKFSDERRVYDAVYYAVRGALETPRRPEAAPELPEPAPEPERPAPRVEVRPMPAQPRPQPEIERRSTESGVDYAAVQCPPEPKLTFRAPAEARTGYEPPSAAPTPPPQPRAPWVPQYEARPAPAAPAPVPEAPPMPVQERLPETEPLPAQEKEPMFSGEREPVRVIGEALELYILAQQGDNLLVIDKHAAHERMIYDRLRRREAEVMSQTCLEPVPYTPDRAAAGGALGGAAAHKLAGLWPGTLRERHLRAALHALRPRARGGALRARRAGGGPALQPPPGQERRP